MTQKILVDMLANVHCHLREDEVVGPLVKLALQGGADVLGPMPNTKDGLREAMEVLHYCLFVEGLAGDSAQVLPIAMMNEATTIGHIEAWYNAGIKDCKIYPLNRTTKSQNGVRFYQKLVQNVRECQRLDVKVHVHPEHPWMLFDNEDAEFAFLPIVDLFLNEVATTMVWEHGTDARCIPFWKEMAKTGRFYLTLTAHHLATNSSASFGDIRAVCKPPIKTMRDQSDLIKLVDEGHGWVMAGLDDAPHPNGAKHVAEGNCACGAYTAPFGLQLYAHALGHMLETQEGVKKFTDFTSRNARKLHGLKSSLKQVALVKKPFRIPASYQAGPWTVEPFWAGKEIDCSLEM